MQGPKRRTGAQATTVTLRVSSISHLCFVNCSGSGMWVKDADAKSSKCIACQVIVNTSKSTELVLSSRD